MLRVLAIVVEIRSAASEMILRYRQRGNVAESEIDTEIIEIRSPIFMIKNVVGHWTEVNTTVDTSDGKQGWGG